MQKFYNFLTSFGEVHCFVLALSKSVIILGQFELLSEVT